MAVRDYTTFPDAAEEKPIGAKGITIFGILMTLCFLAIAVRLVQLQVYQHERHKEDAIDQITGSIRVRERRGNITDAKGSVLAVSVATKACAFDPWMQQKAPGANPERLIRHLTEIFNLSEADIARINTALERNRAIAEEEDTERKPVRFIWIKRRVSAEEWDALSDAMEKARRKAGEAWRNQRRWLRKAGEFAFDKESEAKAREAAAGWRRIAQDEEARFAGIHFPPEYERVYPQQTLASHILGFCDIDGRGLEGVERTCDTVLTGTALRQAIARDARGRALSALATDTRSPMGMTVQLTIDAAVQSIVEEELQNAVEKLKGEYPEVIANAVVMDPFTGDILAMANYPTFDANKPGEFPARNRRNDVVAAVQEPGSTFKPLLIAASLDEKVARFDEEIDCTTYRMDNRRVIKDISPYGRMSLEMALVKSSNPAMVRVGLRRAGADARICPGYGFGESTGSQLPGEVNGMITDAKNWSLFTMGSVPMGYEINVTSLQMVAAYSAIANGGMLPRPNIVKSVVDDANGMGYRTEPVMRHRVISAETAALMRQALRRVVTEGTGRRANIKEYALGGKTGTANMIANDQERAAGVRGYSNRRQTANFIVLAPWDNPRAVISISIRETGKFGGEASSPVGANIARRMLGYWGVPTDNGEPIPYR